MVRVVLSGTLQAAMPEVGEFDIQATNIRQLLKRLGEQNPALNSQLEEGVSVSIDGQIYNDAWFEPLPDDCEVYILPRLSGG